MLPAVSSADQVSTLPLPPPLLPRGRTGA
jgi:hypothetical protein